MSLYKNRYESLIYWIAKREIWSSSHPALSISTWMIMLSKGQKCEEGATEQDIGVWLCSSTLERWAAVLNRTAELISWRTSLFFMNGVWTSKDTKIHDLNDSFMAREVNPTFALSHIKLVWLSRCQGEHKERSLSLSLWLFPNKKWKKRW